jgi:hypothetical protein
MNKTEKKLIIKALKKYQTIYPVSNKDSFQACFSRYGRMNIFWFNTEDNNTHVMTDAPASSPMPADLNPSQPGS